MWDKSHTHTPILQNKWMYTNANYIILEPGIIFFAFFYFKNILANLMILLIIQCWQFRVRVSAGDAVHRYASDAVSPAQRQAAALLPPAGTGVCDRLLTAATQLSPVLVVMTRPIGWGHYALMAVVCLSVCLSPSPKWPVLSRVGR